MKMNEIAEGVEAGRARDVCALVQAALDAGAPALKILNEGLMPGMAAVGEAFKSGEAFVPEMLVAARAMSKGVALLKPHLTSSDASVSGKVVIGTVKGDLHDVGKNLVRMMLESKGLEVIDLGTDVSPEAFVSTAKEQACDIICCSALLTTTMPVMGDVVATAKAQGIRDRVKIMVGGAPVTDAYCREIGADCYTTDAVRCAEMAVEFCTRR